jgi:hypothetical protein
MNYVEIGLNVLNFVKDNWEYFTMIPLVIYYIKNKMWNELLLLAVKESMKFKNVDKKVIPNEVKKENVVKGVQTNWLGKLFSTDKVEEAVEIGYKTQVKE